MEEIGREETEWDGMDRMEWDGRRGMGWIGREGCFHHHFGGDSAEDVCTALTAQPRVWLEELSPPSP